MHLFLNLGSLYPIPLAGSLVTTPVLICVLVLVLSLTCYKYRNQSNKLKLKSMKNPIFLKSLPSSMENPPNPVEGSVWVSKNVGYIFALYRNENKCVRKKH